MRCSKCFFCLDIKQFSKYLSSVELQRTYIRMHFLIKVNTIDIILFINQKA